MKRLTISYDGRDLFDGDIAEFTWSETDDEVTVRGRLTPKPSIGEMLRDAVTIHPDNGRQPPPTPIASEP